MQGLEEALDAHELQLQMAVSCRVGVGIRTLVLCSSNGKILKETPQHGKCA